MESNPATIHDRIRYLIKRMNMSQGQFARRLGIDPANLSKHLSGKLPLTQGLLNRIVVELNVSKDWLVNGNDVPFSKTAGGTIDRERADLLQIVSLPIYDIDVVAGTEPIASMFTEERIIGNLSLPMLKKGDVIVRVSGDSMEPVILPGAYLSIRPDTDTTNILWGQIYVIVMDDYRLVKYLRKGTTDDTVRLVSANPNYDDMIINRSEIRSLYLVDAVLNYQLRC